MPPARIWDVHVHFPRNFQKPDEDPQVALDHMAMRLRETGVVRAGLLCPTVRPDSPPQAEGSAPPLTHESCIEMASKHADLFLPHAVVDPGATTYERMHELHAMGYRALKIIGTSQPYDSKDYFPCYRAAEELSMPILFHCGVIGGGTDLLTRHPRTNAASAKRMREQDETARKVAAGEAAPPGYRSGPRETSAMYMRPFHLDTLANAFPNLKLIGAHFGGTGNYDEAASVSRWRRWVYFDMSGGRTLERHAVERQLIGREFPLEKLIFGSDCAADEVHEHVERFEKIFDGLELSDEEKDLLWYRNAAELFGEAEVQWAPEPAEEAKQQPA